MEETQLTKLPMEATNRTRMMMEATIRHTDLERHILLDISLSTLGAHWRKMKRVCRQKGNDIEVLSGH